MDGGWAGATWARYRGLGGGVQGLWGDENTPQDPVDDFKSPPTRAGIRR